MRMALACKIGAADHHRRRMIAAHAIQSDGDRTHLQTQPARECLLILGLEQLSTRQTLHDLSRIDQPGEDAFRRCAPARPSPCSPCGLRAAGGGRHRRRGHVAAAWALRVDSAGPDADFTSRAVDP